MKKFVTLAEMIDLRKKPIIIPPRFAKLLTAESKESYAIMIFCPSIQTIRLIPVRSNKVIMLELLFPCGEAPEIERLQRIMREEIGGDPFYSTGRCKELRKTCVFEGYFDLADLKVTQAVLKKQLLERIEGVEEVIISTIH